MQKKNKSTEYFAYLNPDNNQALLDSLSCPAFQWLYIKSTIFFLLKSNF